MRKRAKTAPAETPGLEWLPDMRTEDGAQEGFLHVAGKPLLLVILGVVLVVALSVIGYSALKYRSSHVEYGKIRNAHVRTTEDPPAGTQSAHDGRETRPEGADLEIDFDALLAINGDTVAWLELPALQISYPVVFPGSDRDFYLSHTFEGNSNAGGTIFVEPVNLPDFSDCNTFVYGHNSADGSMFGRLRELAYPDREREAELFFYIYRKDGSVGKYRIFSCYVTRDDSDSFVTFDDAYYDTYVALVRKRAVTEIDADFSKHGRIVTLSTCYGGPGTKNRFLVHGVEVDG